MRDDDGIAGDSRDIAALPMAATASIKRARSFSYEGDAFSLPIEAISMALAERGATLNDARCDSL